MAFPHRTDLGNRPCPCSFRAAPHCLFQEWHTVSGPAQSSRGARARGAFGVRRFIAALADVENAERGEECDGALCSRAVPKWQ